MCICVLMFSSFPPGFASPWLMDLIAFLKSVFESFTNLPSRLAGMACMSSCQHLAKSIMNLLMSDNNKAITSGALQQIDLDLVQCEMFASSEPVPGMEEGVLVMCFSDLRSVSNEVQHPTHLCCPYLLTLFVMQFVFSDNCWTCLSHGTGQHILQISAKMLKVISTAGCRRPQH